MARAQGWHRLSRRCRGPLLQRSLSLPAHRGRGAPCRAHHRDLRQGRADRCAPAIEWQRQAHDGPRSHAVQSSPVRRLDHRPHPQRRRPHRPSNRNALRAHLGAQRHPEQGFRSCLGILRLGRAFGVARVEAAATRAIEIGALTYGSVRSILDHKLDRHAAHKPADGAPTRQRNAGAIALTIALSTRRGGAAQVTALPSGARTSFRPPLLRIEIGTLTVTVRASVEALGFAIKPPSARSNWPYAGRQRDWSARRPGAGCRHHRGQYRPARPGAERTCSAETSRPRPTTRARHC